MKRKLNAYFEPDEEFEAPLLAGEPLKERFTELHEALVSDVLVSTETLALHAPVKHAANEAAGLAWTTAFPLLVFPLLFTEKVETVRQRDERGRRIKAKSAELMVEAVV